MFRIHPHKSHFKQTLVYKKTKKNKNNLTHFYWSVFLKRLSIADKTYFKCGVPVVQLLFSGTEL